MSKTERKPLDEIDLSELKPEEVLEFPPSGLPGFRQIITYQIYYADPDHPLHSEEYDGTKGEYKVIFTLSRPGVSLHPDRKKYIAFEDLEGDSHLAIAKPAHPHPDAAKSILKSNTANEELTYICLPNSKGFLGRIELESIEANNYNDAFTKASQKLSPILSDISYRHDVPLNIYQADIIELKTDSRKIVLTNDFKETPAWNEIEKTVSGDFLKYASYYREGLTSNSVFYQFLCYYKIIEGIRARRDRIIETAKRGKRQIPAKLKSQLPDTEEGKLEWLNALFKVPQQWDEMGLSLIFPKQVEGRTVGNLIAKNSELHQLRLKIAHSILENGEPTVSADDIIDVETIHKWLPVAKYLARYLLDMEFPDRTPDNSPKDGTIKLYVSRDFATQDSNGRLVYIPNERSLEYIMDIQTRIENGVTKVPSGTLNPIKDGVSINAKGKPTAIYVGMELHDDGTEHLAFIGFFISSNDFRIYPKK